MKKFTILLFTVLLTSFSTKSFAQCDPWIVSGYKELFGRAPSSSECNIKNYNNGSWRSYCELVRYIAGYNRFGDNWIFQAYCELYTRTPNKWELNIKNYNNGSWNNYNELKTYISRFQSTLSGSGLGIITVTGKGQTLAIFTENKKAVTVNLISADGANVVAAGGANVVAAGGANVVAAGGANVVASGGANVVASGGANLIGQAGGNLTAKDVSNLIGQAAGNLQNLGSAAFGSSRGTLSAGEIRVSTGSGSALVIKK
ncbi:MAG: hypothetical protein JWR18_1935 [Segetibacter sp.]|jgi:hypothetical protein|nr:hypothetical protein [Segetibacter sp.]